MGNGHRFTIFHIDQIDARAHDMFRTSAMGTNGSDDLVENIGCLCPGIIWRNGMVGAVGCRGA